MRRRRTLVIVSGLILSAPALARAEGPADLPSAFSRSFDGVDACATLRDVAPGAQSATSDVEVCARRAPPCATFNIPASVIAMDRGVVPDANAPIKRNPPVEGDPAEGISLREAFRKSEPWVFEEAARRVGADAMAKALSAMRYGNAEARGPLERLGSGDDSQSLALSPVEQVDFLSRLKRGELTTSAESQARTVEVFPYEKIGDGGLAIKTATCGSTAWAVGWVDRSQRSTIFAVALASETPSAEDVAARAKQLLSDLGLLPQPPKQ